MSKKGEFLRDDIDTYKPKYKLLLPMCKVEEFRPKNSINIGPDKL